MHKKYSTRIIQIKYTFYSVIDILTLAASDWLPSTICQEMEVDTLTAQFCSVYNELSRTSKEIEKLNLKKLQP